jgi:hypothetical protein
MTVRTELRPLYALNIPSASSVAGDFRKSAGLALLGRETLGRDADLGTVAPTVTVSG